MSATERVGQAEHLAETTRDVAAVGRQLERAAGDYGGDGPGGLAGAGHADTWRLDLELISAERALRAIRRSNAAWRQANELAVIEAAEED